MGMVDLKLGHEPVISQYCPSDVRIEIMAVSDNTPDQQTLVFQRVVKSGSLEDLPDLRQSIIRYGACSRGGIVSWISLAGVGPEEENPWILRIKGPPPRYSSR